MSVLVYHKPKDIDLAGNHLFFKVKGTDYIVSAGTRAHLRLSGTTTGQDGKYITITCMGNTHKILFSNFPVNGLDGADIVIYSGKYPGELADHIKAYPPIADYYIVEGDGGQNLFFTAKNTGDEYNITGSVETMTTWSFPEEVPGEGESYRENYAIKALLSVEDLSSAGTYKALPEFALGLDNEQLAEFEIGEIVRRRFRQFMEVPDFANVTIKLASLMVMQYKLDVKEVAGSTVLSSVKIGPLKALNGKVNAADHQDFDLRGWLGANKQFLTNQPGRIYTYKDARHYLYFMNAQSGNATSLRVKLELLHTADNSATVNYFDVPTMVQDSVAIVPVSNLVNSIAVNGEVYEARVSVIGADNTVSAGVQIYHYMPKRLFAKSLIFQNRYGAFDTVTINTQSNQVKVSKDENRRVLTQGYSRYAGDLSSDEAELEDIFTAETGPIPMGMVQHYKELVSSNAVFLQTDDRFVKVWIEKGSFNIADDSDELQNVKFKYKPAFAGDIISSDIKLPEPAHKDYSSDYLEADYQ